MNEKSDSLADRRIDAAVAQLDFRLNASRQAPTVARFLNRLKIGPLASTIKANQAKDEPSALDDAEVERLGEEFAAILERHGEAISRAVLKEAQKRASKDRRHLRGFQARLYKKWRSGLNLLTSIVTVSHEVGAELNCQFRQSAFEGGDVLFDTLVRLHARACKVFREIECLLRSGFADGAHARWRTLHEIAVASRFISKRGERAARLFRVHDRIHVCAAMEEFQLHCEILRETPYPESVIASVKRERDHLKAKYGKNIALPYGWAASLLEIDRCGIEKLEAEVGLSHLRPYYRMASLSIHPYARSLEFELGKSAELPLLLAGASNRGLADPGHSACLSLLQVTSTFVEHWPAIQLTILLSAMTRMVDRAGAELHKVHHEVESAAAFEDEIARIGVEYKSVSVE